MPRAKKTPPKPEKPKRLMIPHSRNIYHYESPTLGDLIESGIPLTARLFVEEEYGYDDYSGHIVSTNIQAAWEEPETDRQYQQRIDSWKRRVERWEKKYGKTK